MRENEGKYKIVGGPNNRAIGNFLYWYKMDWNIRFIKLCTMLSIMSIIHTLWTVYNKQLVLGLKILNYWYFFREAPQLQIFLKIVGVLIKSCNRENYPKIFCVGATTIRHPRVIYEIFEFADLFFVKHLSYRFFWKS